MDGDLDPRVVKQCLVELAYPIACVYRDAVSSHQWPMRWKCEKQVMLKKCPNPQTKDDMRNLGLSPFFNKGLESSQNGCSLMCAATCLEINSEAERNAIQTTTWLDRWTSCKLSLMVEQMMIDEPSLCYP